LDVGEKKGRVIAIGCSRFVRSDYPLRNSNYVAFVNLLDWSVQDEVLLSIRSKATPRRPLKEMSDGQRMLVKIFLILFLPVLVIGIALVVFIRRKRHFRRVVGMYA
jgi:ABC-type uncharacterized transport system involved in gliding motility auxiliary subunit